MDSQYTIVVRGDGSNYVALCIELNLLRQASSLEEVKRSMVEAITEYLLSDEDGGSAAQPFPLELLREFLTEGIDEELAAGEGFLFSKS